MIESGIFDVVDARQFVVSAKFQLFGQTDASDSDLWFEVLANEAIREFDCLSLFVKRVCKIKVVDHKAKLPAGFNRLLGLRYNTGNGCSDMVYVDQKFITSIGCDTNFAWVTSLTGTFEIQDGYIFIHTEPVRFDEEGNPIVETDEITELTLAYYGLNVDDKGLMKAYSEMERGVRSYICYQFCLQNMDIPKYAAQMSVHHETWKAQKRKLKARDFQNNFRYNRAEVMQWATALIGDKNDWTITYNYNVQHT